VADLRTLDKTLAAKSASDSHHSAAQVISDYPNDLYMAAHREADGVPELHETQADVFFVESGTATLVWVARWSTRRSRRRTRNGREIEAAYGRNYPREML